MLRATLKSLLSRKLRLVLSGFAIILGVMFVASAFVLTDSLGGRFEQLFQTINKDVAVQVQATDEAREEVTPPLLTEADLDRLAAVDGVRAVAGDASSEGITPFRKDNGKALPAGAPHLGIGLADDDFVADGLLHVAEGRAAQADSEVTLTRYTAEQTGHKIGDRIKIYVPRSATSPEWTVVGLLEYSGGRTSLGGETMVGFTVPEAQRLFYGTTGVFGAAQLEAEPGVSQETLKQRVATATPAGFEAITGQEAADEQASQLKQLLTFVNWFFLGFALIALLVGMFLIFNTFNIIIAQRSRELALLRALGASWRQVTGSVLVEAVVVGVIASTLGLGAGIAVAAGLQALTGALGFPLPEGGLTVSGTAILASYLVGVVMTVIAALVPAVRAAGVPPIAAMRDVVRPDKSLRGLTITGGVITAISVALLSIGLVGVEGLTAVALGGGVLLAVVGVALLSPALTRPVAGTIGLLVSWGTATGIGRRNTLRNPRRTAVTAAALMVGVTLVSAVSVIGASLKASVTDLVENDLSAAVIVTTGVVAPPTGKEGFDPARLDQAARIPGVTAVLATHLAVLPVDGNANSYVQAADLPTARSLMSMEQVSGTLTPTGQNEAIVDDGTAETNGWKLGSTFVVTMPVGGDRTYTIAGIYQRTTVANGVILPPSQVKYFAGPLAFQGLVQVSEGTDVIAVTRQVEQLMADYPLVSVVDQASFIKQQTSAVDQLLVIFYVLLALAVLVAFLGIINTLVLSIYERTRELGLLRAVGMGRRQIMAMVGVESLLMAVFGCLLGVGLGVALGVTVTEVLRNLDAISIVALPYLQLVGFLVAAALAGVLAAAWPAWRASRLNVLQAISYE
ncbi:ABC transporter permease [Micromonospora sp. NBC_01796]|uniref:ABC transporter permease n=1 Tax=Micromonospora sp. NBC_01796 TaxID=2975987 RepID=UPI002DD829C6|nr:ABC transporter permease [Micromonospora sp. NBC_01796]WSA85260.1 ABC transporter permease [Micromonospora sp. NBC_01796]